MVDRQVDRLIIIGMVIFIIMNYIYDHFPISIIFENEFIKDNIWYWGQTIAMFMFSLALLKSKRSTVTELLVVIVFGQLVDEFIGDPTKPSYMDYAWLSVYFIYKVYIRINGRRGNRVFSEGNNTSDGGSIS